VARTWPAGVAVTVAVRCARFPSPRGLVWDCLWSASKATLWRDENQENDAGRRQLRLPARLAGRLTDVRDGASRSERDANGLEVTLGDEGER
jgi:hypothetical protein